MHCDTDWWDVRSRQPTRRGAGKAREMFQCIRERARRRPPRVSRYTVYIPKTRSSLYAIELKH